MVSINAPTFALGTGITSQYGAAIPREIGRRAKRVPVLDLAVGAVLVDGGYSPSDLIFSLQLPDETGADYQRLNAMVEDHQQLILSCAKGCYSVAISALANSGGLTTASAAVIEELG